MNAYRGGKVHVVEAMCSSCIFRPGNLMRLQPGRRDAMVADAKRKETAIICHSTLYRDGVDSAVCRGFFDRHSTIPLRLARIMGVLVFDPPNE